MGTNNPPLSPEEVERFGSDPLTLLCCMLRFVSARRLAAFPEAGGKRGMGDACGKLHPASSETAYAGSGGSTRRAAPRRPEKTSGMSQQPGAA